MVKFNVNSVSLIFTLRLEKKKDKKRKCCIVDVLTQSPQKCPASKGQLTSGGFGANQRALLFKKKRIASGPVAVVARNPPSGFFARK